jgi:hypothetical protein
MYPQRDVRRILVHLWPLRLYRVREETLRRCQGDIRVRLRTKLPKRANAETQVLKRMSGENRI